MDAYTRISICESFRRAVASNTTAILDGDAGQDPVFDFAYSTVEGLAARPRRLECRFLYDRAGSELFERITEQPEYYLTRTETALLAAHAEAIRAITGAVTLSELGSGSSLKTRILLQAWLERGDRVRYVPIDVSRSALSGACRLIESTFSSVLVIAVNSEYRCAFPLFRELSPLLVLFLGSSLGNFSPGHASVFLGALAASLSADDFLLLGLDLAKDPEVIERAYNDAAGITADFTRNIFARMNRELGSRLNVDSIQHVARYLPDQQEVEIKAQFTASQVITVSQLGQRFPIRAGEAIEVERCRKYSLEAVLPYLESFGLHCEATFTDDRKWYALVLLRRI
ncbi:L-histidine N(alpha)-methyltransferase [Geomesophilobacter sediminis]|uniref:L-histidine N(Alpha)-methyltransferase n=1 Tax=Geomesophilobacter sediminis TaxID=2798584 RepID=A0A8J7LW43_9BACT|nr:L-histidine N(alpha)-methyltransferase [Geomesophilobacter sediminis]MBJ6726299.1 L-histidine N(alpha)-methyltransferase [Geomesophilobacter sediminis]